MGHQSDIGRWDKPGELPILEGGGGAEGVVGTGLGGGPRGLEGSCVARGWKGTVAERMLVLGSGA